jgi:asparagine synthase (glutamine-hydrolysing)
MAACRATSIPLAIEEYFALGYVAEPRTIFSAARKLPPAHTLLITSGQPVPARANMGRALRTGRPCAPTTKHAKELVARLANRSALRMIAEVPARCLSLGRRRFVDGCRVDVRDVGRTVNTCSIAFSDPAVQRIGVRAGRLPTAITPITRIERVESDDFDLIDKLACLRRPYATARRFRPTGLPARART